VPLNFKGAEPLKGTGRSLSFDETAVRKIFIKKIQSQIYYKGVRGAAP